MRSLTWYSLAASAACSAAIAVPTRNWLQTSIEATKKHHEEYNLEPSANFAFAGITTFAQLPQAQCLTETGPVDDILILGFPFDTATSYRTGARFGPNAVRQGSRAASLAYVIITPLLRPILEVYRLKIHVSVDITTTVNPSIHSSKTSR